MDMWKKKKTLTKPSFKGGFSFKREVVGMVHEECLQIGPIATLSADMENMKGWQKNQNGAIYRVEEKIDRLIFWGMTFAASTIVTLVVLIIKN